MLNEERVKHMTKLAFYETKGGSEDIKVGFCLKKKYIRFCAFWSALWMTLAYIAVIFIVWLLLLSELMDKFAMKQMMALILSFLGIYIILLIMYIRYTKNISKKKHARAYHGMKNFQEELERLEKMYEKEDGNE